MSPSLARRGYSGFGLRLPKAEKGKSQMEEVPSSPTTLVVSSPRRTLSLLRERRSSASSSDVAFSFNHDRLRRAAGDRSAAGFAGEHGPKPSEVYGFVGSITTVIATGYDLISSHSFLAGSILILSCSDVRLFGWDNIKAKLLTMNLSHPKINKTD
jgi:hypothetical protein